MRRFLTGMNRAELEHILRACKGTTGVTEFIVIGSQSILGKHPDAPRVLRKSMELDVYPRLRPDLSPHLAGNLGEMSLFHQTHGIWVDGVDPETATLPAGWEERLVRVCNDNTGGATGWCLEPHELAYAKLAAREGEGRGVCGESAAAQARAGVANRGADRIGDGRGVTEKAGRGVGDLPGASGGMRRALK